MLCLFRIQVDSKSDKIFLNVIPAMDSTVLQEDSFIIKRKQD